MSVILKQLDSLLEDIQYEISLLANTSAFLNQVLEDVSWVGFYLLQDNKLILGPFQGKIACTTIPLGKGVCGISAQEKKIYRVDNVHGFPTHIACDSASNSEIVLPILWNDTLYGVLDIDSISVSRFQEKDQILLEQLLQVLQKHIERVKG